LRRRGGRRGAPALPRQLHLAVPGRAGERVVLRSSVSSPNAARSTSATCRRCDS
jgi:hypothetical protein